MTNNPLRLGTRGSALALWQARWVASRLREQHPDLEIAETIIKTEGDRRTDQFGAGDNGVFVHRIEQALTDDEIEMLEVWIAEGCTDAD